MITWSSRLVSTVRSEVLAVGARCHPVEQLFLDDLKDQLLGPTADGTELWRFYWNQLKFVWNWFKSLRVEWWKTLYYLIIFFDLSWWMYQLGYTEQNLMQIWIRMFLSVSRVTVRGPFTLATPSPRFDFEEPKDRRSLDNALQADLFRWWPPVISYRQPANQVW